MITLKPIIVPSNRRQDGTWPVVIRLTFQGKSRRIATPLVCTPQDLSRSLHIRTNSPVMEQAQGVDKSTIDDCLAHKGDYSVTDIYAEKAWHLMTEANEKVLSLFAWVGA